MKNIKQLSKIINSLIIISTVTFGITKEINADPNSDGMEKRANEAMPMMDMEKRPNDAMPPMPMMGMGMKGGGGMCGMLGGGGGNLPPFLRGLKLTEEQNDKIYELVHAQGPNLRNKGKEIHKAHLALHNLVLSDQYNEAKAKELTENNARLIAEMMQMVAANHNKIYQLLTPEQRKKLEERQAMRKKDVGGED